MRKTIYFLLIIAIVAGSFAMPFVPQAHAAGEGDIAVYREATGTDAITTSNFDHDWDTTVTEDSSTFSQSGSSITLGEAGHYAVMYGSRFDSTGGSNRRNEFQTQLRLAGSDVPIGWSQCYIRRNAGTDECVTSGGGIINANADDVLGLRTFRTDSYATGTAQREPNASSISIVRLDDSWDYLRLSKTGTQAGPTSSTWVEVTYDRQDEVDTGSFSHTGGSADVTLVAAGHYLVFANTYGSLGSTVNDRTLVRQKLTLDGSDVDGSNTTIYIRGHQNSHSTQEGAVSTGMIIETSSTNQVLNVEVNRGDGTNAWTINNDDTASYVDRTALTIVKLPDTGDYIRLDDSGTDNINPATLTPMGWNTEDEIDTDSFTHNDSQIEVDVTDDYLFLSTLYCAACGVARAYFNAGWTIDDGSLLQYSQFGNYNRNSGANDAGNWGGALFADLAAGSYIQVESQQLAATGTLANDVKGVQGVRLGSLFSVVETITLTIDSGTTVELGEVTAGTRNTATTRIMVDTNSSNGYEVSVGRDRSSPAHTMASAGDPSNIFINDTEGGLDVFDGVGSCTATAPWAAGSSTGVGFTIWAADIDKNSACWGTGDTETSANNEYAALQASVSASAALDTTGNSPNPSYASIGWSLDVTDLQRATTYTGDVVITAIVNP